jgi:hypothetical protein
VASEGADVRDRERFVGRLVEDQIANRRGRCAGNRFLLPHSRGAYALEPLGELGELVLDGCRPPRALQRPAQNLGIDSDAGHRLTASHISVQVRTFSVSLVQKKGADAPVTDLRP